MIHWSSTDGASEAQKRSRTWAGQWSFIVTGMCGLGAGLELADLTRQCRLLAHAFSPAEIADLGEFIEARLPSVQIPNRIRDELNEMRCQAVPTAASKLLAMRDPV